MTTKALPGQVNIEEHTFRDLVKGREIEFPTLSRAALRSDAANSVAIEWDVGPDTWVNWTQIFREPYRGPVRQRSTIDVQSVDTVAEDALTKFLRSIEDTLEYGVPSYNHSIPLTACGGYRHYLGRGLRDKDVLILRPLREPMLRTYEWDYVQGEWTDLDFPRFEWLCETSLVVIPEGV